MIPTNEITHSLDLFSEWFELGAMTIELFDYGQEFDKALNQKEWNKVGCIICLSLMVLGSALYLTPYLAGLLSPYVANLLGVSVAKCIPVVTLGVAWTMRKVVKIFNKIII
ncbi:hypothetical protein LLS47_24215 [Rouxiella badensis]|uniref:hypothetical protein n=1 Tax=Rouxiella badensis TaxID=1646377 RepID=UPI001D1367F8|nr:hypothetical protein [Rouxiella badensis]MCC3721512.1 hypothetical protein [Rouxiella badensis]MCC3731038.1 hypothetical protein [Rouxiella badensis]MCC3736003.1 hypothetical protein [Rouxiella badensis]MCC3742618.1 hypothetical protein [Rouxiella badensis]MCC3761400.1 hypothetical protein [Rouxiella badensis]